MLVYRYVDESSSATMLAAKRSAGVAPEVKLRNQLRKGNEACKRGDPLALKPSADLKRGYQWPH